jgi:ribonuclease HII
MVKRSDKTAGPDCSRERAQGGLVAGVDEAGRGPWAGPVCAAAVILDLSAVPPGIADSKTLTAGRRAALATLVRAGAQVGVGWASVAEIDSLNILGATMLAMTRAVAALPRKPDHLLIDGNRLPDTGIAATAVVDGDALSLSIAAASIVAKVERDRVMADLDVAFPAYGFARHKGYGTAAHAQALAVHGPCPHHRLSFSPVKKSLKSRQ